MSDGHFIRIILPSAIQIHILGIQNSKASSVMMLEVCFDILPPSWYVDAKCMCSLFYNVRVCLYIIQSFKIDTECHILTV